MTIKCFPLQRNRRLLQIHLCRHIWHLLVYTPYLPAPPLAEEWWHLPRASCVVFMSVRWTNALVLTDIGTGYLPIMTKLVLRCWSSRFWSSSYIRSISWTLFFVTERTSCYCGSEAFIVSLYSKEASHARWQLVAALILVLHRPNMTCVRCNCASCWGHTWRSSIQYPW